MAEGSITSQAATTSQRPLLEKSRPGLALAISLATPLALFLSLPPFNLWPLAFVALVPLFRLYLDRSVSTRRIFWLSTLAGSLYWASLFQPLLIAVPTENVYFAQTFLKPLLGFGYLILAMGAGFGWGVYAVLARRLLHHAVPLPVFWLASLWSLLEILRSWLYWNFTGGIVLGYSLPAEGWFGQVAGLGSVWLVSFGLVLVNWLVAFCFSATIPQLRWRRGLPTVAVLLIWLTSGAALRTMNHDRNQTAPVISGVAIQSHRSTPTDLGDPRRYENQLLASQKPPPADQDGLPIPQIIVLPEVTYGLDPTQVQAMSSRPTQIIYPDLASLESALRQKIPPATTIVAGFVDTTRETAWLNGASVVPGVGPSSLASKRYLFPFGEYLPLPWVWPAGLRTFYRYTVPPALDLATTPLGPISVLFCNELFSVNLALADVQRGAKLMTGLSSNFDVATPWFAAWQIRVASYRAVENWRSVILAVDQGQSALIQPTGEVVTVAPYRTTTTLQALLPIRTDHSPLGALVARFYRL